MEENYFNYGLLFIYAICLISSNACLVILWHDKSKNVNQRCLIINLMIVEFSFSFVQIVLTCQELAWVTFAKEIVFSLFFLRLVIAFVYIAIMHCICSDRLFEVYFHLTYPLKFTKKRANIAVASIWLFGIVFALILTLLSQYRYSLKQISEFAFYFFFATDIAFVFVAVSTYAYLYAKFRHVSKLLQEQSKRFQHSFKSPKFLLPCVIILSYLLFDITGAFLSVIAALLNVQSYIYRKIALILLAMGILSDCATYILINPNVRKMLFNRFSCVKYKLKRGSRKNRKVIRTDALNLPRIVISEPSTECKVPFQGLESKDTISNVMQNYCDDSDIKKKRNGKKLEIICDE